MARDQPDLVIAPEAPNRRALILPGGGMRVAYQAGAVKALYDSGLRFSFADGASGGTARIPSSDRLPAPAEGRHGNNVPSARSSVA